MAWIFSGKEGLQAANDGAAGRFSYKINDGLRKYAPDDDQEVFFYKHRFKTVASPLNYNSKGVFMRKAVRNSWSHTKPRGFLIIDIQTGELSGVRTSGLSTLANVKQCCSDVPFYISF